MRKSRHVPAVPAERNEHVGGAGIVCFHAPLSQLNPSTQTSHPAEAIEWHYSATPRLLFQKLLPSSTHACRKLTICECRIPRIPRTQFVRSWASRKESQPEVLDRKTGITSPE
jgi:hypothetical protein